MQRTLISLLLLLGLIIVAQQQAAPSVVNVNFEGDFDSMNHISPTSE